VSTEDFTAHSGATDEALVRAFGGLRVAADALPPHGAAAARALGVRQARVRTIAALVAASVATAAIVAVGALVARGAATPVVGVSQTPTPSPISNQPPTGEPSASGEATEPAFPTGSPVEAPPGCSTEYFVFPAAPHAGDALPVAVMLTGKDWGGPCWLVSRDTPGYTLYEPSRDAWALPDPCADQAPYPADEHRVAGRSRSIHGGIELGAFESITRYAPGQAQAFLQQVRDRVAACASFPDPDVGLMYSQIAAQGFAGDESVVVYTGTASTPTDYIASYVAVVRVGDYVIVVDHSSDLSANLTVAKTMAVKATAKLRAVIGG
jgi:hypothetical protein